MAITLVGIFDKSEQAQEAREQIAEEGVGDDLIRLTSNTTDTQAPTRAEDHRGFFARLFGLDAGDERPGHYAEAVRRGSCVVTVDVADAAEADKVSDIMEECGAIDVDQRVEQWKSRGYTGFDPAAAPYTRQQVDNEQQALKVVQEELKVGKRTVERGGVRVVRHTTERPINEQVRLREEKVSIERRPVDRAATPAEMESFGKNDKTVELRETAEEPVVSKTARVVEEVAVGKRSSERTENINETVRRTDVDVEKLDPRKLQQGSSSPQRPSPSQR